MTIVFDLGRKAIKQKQMGTDCDPRAADMLLFCYGRDFMLSFSGNNQANDVEAFNSTSRYLNALLNIDNPYFK